MFPLQHFLLIGATLFCLGVVIIITKRNAIVVLMGIELILNAANINLIAFSRYDANLLQGQLFSLFVIVVAAAEAAVALAIILRIYHYYQTVYLDKLQELKEK
jgi:NADH-quinone oxidoreductase subunit K